MLAQGAGAEDGYIVVELLRCVIFSWLLLLSVKRRTGD